MAYFDSVAKSTKDFFKRVREGSVRCERRERAAGTDMSGTHAQAASLPPRPRCTPHMLLFAAVFQQGQHRRVLRQGRQRCGACNADAGAPHFQRVTQAPRCTCWRTMLTSVARFGQC